MEVLIQSEFQNITQKYKNQLEEVSSTVAILKQRVTNLKSENSNLQEKNQERSIQKDLEKYCKVNEQYGRRLYLRIKIRKKQEYESSDKVLEAVKSLFSVASINIPDSCIDRAHRIRRTDDTVIVCVTTFCHCTIFYEKRKEFKNRVKVHLDLTKGKLDPLIKASKYVNRLSNIGFVYADINC